MKKTSLSDKRDYFHDMDNDHWIYYQRDVKEAVKSLRNIVNNCQNLDEEFKVMFLSDIDEIFGDKLVEKEK